MIKIGDLICYDVNELSKLLKMNKRIIRKYISSGKLKGKKIGKKYYVAEKSIKEFLTG